MRITLLIIILSKEEDGSGFFLSFFNIFLFFLISILAQPSLHNLGSVLALQLKDPVCVLLSSVPQLSPAVVICQHLMPGIWQSTSPLSMMYYSIDAEEEA